MKNDIRDIWKAIESARADSAHQECKHPMNGPVAPEVLEQRLARVIGRPVPQQLRESLLIHDGMSQQGSWAKDVLSLIPCNAAWIEKIWTEDRQREAEAIAEGDEVVKFAHYIPVASDCLFEHNVYIDARNGKVLCYVCAGLYIEDFRYESYLSFLQDIHHHIESDSYFEWPQIAP